MTGHNYFDELMERNAALRTENEKLRLQVADLLPFVERYVNRGLESTIDVVRERCEKMDVRLLSGEFITTTIHIGEVS
jgi:regulator of replication initiation timing